MAKKKSYDSAAMTLLATIITANRDNQFPYTSAIDRAALEADKLVEANAQFPDGAGRFMTRATPKGIEFMNKANATAQSPSESQTIGAGDVGSVPSGAIPGNGGRPEYLIENDVPMPAIVGRGRTGSTYPFDQLEIGQSFKVNKPAKNLASTISSANKRYAEDIPGAMRQTRKGVEVQATRQVRQFVVRTVEGGSRIWRVQPSAN